MGCFCIFKAEEALRKLKKEVDTLIVVSNDKLLEIVPRGETLRNSFLTADESLQQAITGISDMIVKPGLVNLDFADVKATLTNAGTSLPRSCCTTEHDF